MKNMGAVRLLTGALSFFIGLSILASTVALEDPPGGCDLGWSMYGTGGATRVEDPASAFLCQFERVRVTPYGSNHTAGIISALGRREVSTLSWEKGSTGRRRDDRTRALTV